MDLFRLFKKDYFNYLLSVIIPAIMSGITIPLFKHLLGASGYGNFSLWMNAVFIFTAVLTAWISQSIFRYYPQVSDKVSFCKKALSISFYTQIIFLVPGFLLAWYIGKDLIIALLCSFLLFVISIQFSILPIIQSNFLSKKIIFSELIRTCIYLSVALALLHYTDLNNTISLFISVIISYTISLFYLLKQFYSNTSETRSSENLQINALKVFLSYGAPLSAWFIFSYLITYLDKVCMLKFCGAEIMGNYQAMFDLVYKSITLLLSPVVTSLFPLLTLAYEKGNVVEIRILLKRIILLELLAFLFTSLIYWLGASELLLYILKVPNEWQYKWIGFIIISGAFIWQLAILAQKKFELKMRSLFLLTMIFISLIFQILFYTLKPNINTLLIYPLGFLLASLVYLTLISFTEIVSYLKKRLYLNKE